MRGFLVIGVFLHHAVINYYFLRTGVWMHPWSKVYNLLGQVAVNFFFIITSFLFWSKAAAGSDSVRLLPLYRGRLLRIAPMYFFWCAVIVVIVLVMTGPPPRGTRAAFAGNITPMLSMGFQEWKELNGVQPMELNAHVAWTLGYEWAFYLALPILAYFARPGRRFVVVLLGFAAFYIYRIVNGAAPPSDPSFYFLFLVGAAIAQLLAATGPIAWLAGPLGSILFLICVVLMPVLFYQGYNLGAYLLTGAAFFPLVHGNTVFGLLSSRGAKTLGVVSYSIYLVHATVLRCSGAMLRPFAGSAGPDLAAWGIISVQGLMVVAVSR